MTTKLMALVALLAMTAACERPGQTARTDQAQRPDTQEPQVALVPLAPGGGKPQTEKDSEARRLMNDPEQIAAGQQLFSAFNCVGCHFHGGGGMGPPLMGDVRIYGSSIENIAASIREGRPKGMPSFRGFVPEEQIWQLAAYVHSLSQPKPEQHAAQ